VIIPKSETVVLASSSNTRRDILEKAGVVVEAIAPRIDEEEIKQAMIAENAGGADIAEVLAEQKARSVSRQRPQDLVIGADQILEMDGQIYSKPENLAAARHALTALRGREHRLFSCVCVLRDGQRLWHNLDSAKLTMRAFSDEFLETYLQSIEDQAFAGPGSYRIEDVGSQLFSKVSGDYFTILGLPLLPLLEYLRVQGALQL
jgi:septum formation protein